MDFAIRVGVPDRAFTGLHDVHADIDLLLMPLLEIRLNHLQIIINEVVEGVVFEFDQRSMRDDVFSDNRDREDGEEDLDRMGLDVRSLIEREPDREDVEPDLNDGSAVDRADVFSHAESRVSTTNAAQLRPVGPGARSPSSAMTCDPLSRPRGSVRRALSLRRCERWRTGERRSSRHGNNPYISLEDRLYQDD